MSSENVQAVDTDLDIRINPVIAMARNLLRKRISDLNAGKIIISDPLDSYSGEINKDDVVVNVHDFRFYIDVLISGSKGAASAYRDGYWTCNDLTGLFRLMVRNLDSLDSMESGLASIGNWWLRRRHKARNNSIEGSRNNIQSHYDLGNEMFSIFLDPTMTYSSGYFLSDDSSMEQASIEKIDRICRKLNLKPHHRVLEIGTGWGSFAIHAAKNYRCHVTTTTISKQQFKLASQRVREQGLQERIDIKLCDYRELEGQYDRLVSIEMIEAVGHEYLPGYFAACSRLLSDDGQACIQAITMPDHRYDDYLKTSDFIQEYIFPGSCVPSFTAIQHAITQSSDFRLNHLEDFGLHYARTMRQWLNKFMSSLDTVRQLGYGDDFIRLWEYYMCYCEAGFLERYTSVVQVVLNKPQCSSIDIGLGR
jgi:cyclopropane-fatty-acyl-phospholipid synthase